MNLAGELLLFGYEVQEVISHDSCPIKRSDTLDPNLANQPKTSLQLSKKDRAALVSFLKTLTDPKYQQAQ